MSQTVVAGQVNTQVNAFTSTTDQTANVLYAIAEFIANHGLGPEMTFDVGGYTLDISVAKREDIE